MDELRAPRINERDAYGRRRSSRSVKTGPGSRGGHWHELAYRAAYYRAWRWGHPEYRERERRRRLLLHAITRLTRMIESEGDDGAR